MTPHLSETIGNMYDKGLGTQINKIKAYEWYEASARYGNVNAQYVLAQKYHTGIGVLFDNEKAHMWATIAASNGKCEGFEFRNFLESKMSSPEISKAKKLAERCKKSNYKRC